MPAILIKEYKWRQTKDKVFINTPIIGNPKIVDLFAIKNYVKASYPPFIFELFLWGEIVDEDSECILDKAKGEVIFRLKKCESLTGNEWPSLVADDLDKVEKNDRRSKALEQAEKLIVKREKLKSDKRNELQKQAVRAQINLDTSILNDIDMRRDNERKEAMNDFENWKSNIDDPMLSSIDGKLQNNRKAYRPALKWFKNEKGDLESREMRRAEVFSGLGKIVDNEDTAFKEIEGSIKDKSVSSLGGMENNDRGGINVISNFDEDKNDKEELKLNEKNDEEDNPSSRSSSEDDEEEEEAVSGGCDTTTMEYYIRKINARRESNDRKKLDGSDNNRRGIKSTAIERRRFNFSMKNMIFDQGERIPVPLPRNYSIIDVKFSERKFPTPARESNQAEEQEWLEKQAEARRQTGFVVEDLRPEELDPQWLKDKGDEFFKAGNYLGSISAYSHGIKFSPKMSSLYSNRSAAHYAIGNYLRCTEDCSKALELMVPHCKGNLESRAKCHARRGAALCKLSSPQHGIPELEEALKLDPDNGSVKRDLEAARQYFGIHR